MVNPWTIGTNTTSELEQLKIDQRGRRIDDALIPPRDARQNIHTTVCVRQWRWEQEAHAALKNNTKNKVAEIDLAKHIEQNIEQDQNKCLEDAFYKLQSNRKKKEMEEEKIAHESRLR